MGGGAVVRIALAENVRIGVLAQYLGEISEVRFRLRLQFCFVHGEKKT